MSTYWKCPTCNYVMTEEQSKGYRGCPTGMHAVKHEPLEWDKLGFEIPTDRGYSARALHLKKPNDGDALIEIFKDGEPLRRFLFPAYKIWNIAAHFQDIIIDMSTPSPLRAAIMDETDMVERRVMGKLDALGKELIELRAENNMLKGVIVAHADLRALIGELREIHSHMHNGQVAQARAALGELLRRFDRESEP